MARTNDAPIEDATQIALLASPTRIDIVDTLESLRGAVTVAELATQLGRPADGLYYHLRQLAAAGLIEEDASSGGRRYRRRAPTGTRVRLRYRPGATANARAVDRVAAAALRVAARDFARAIADPRSVVQGAARDLWISRGKGWVGAAELREINRLLVRLADLLQRPRTPRRDRLVALSWVLAPVDAKPARRARAATPAATRGRSAMDRRGC